MRKQPPPHSNLQLRTRKTVLDNWMWLGATEGVLQGNNQVTPTSLRHAFWGKEFVGLGRHDEIVPV